MICIWGFVVEDVIFWGWVLEFFSDVFWGLRNGGN